MNGVNHRATGGHEPEYLALDGILGVVNETTPNWQHARLFLTGDGATEFVPNLRHNEWLRGLDLRAQDLHQIQDKRAADIQGHVFAAGTGPGRTGPRRHVAVRRPRRSAPGVVCAGCAPLVRQPGGHG